MKKRIDPAPAIAVAAVLIAIVAIIAAPRGESTAAGQQTLPSATGYRPYACSVLDRGEEALASKTYLERNYVSPQQTVDESCPEHSATVAAILAQPTAALSPSTPRPTWTPAPAPASALEYQESIDLLRSLWDDYPQSMRDGMCADGGYWIDVLDDADLYHKQAVSEFKAQVC